jgi:hypothetical protein
VSGFEVSGFEVPVSTIEKIGDRQYNAKRRTTCSTQLANFTQSRDGGTGRRSGLKIRRPSGLGGSTPPPGTMVLNELCKFLLIADAPSEVQVCANCECSAQDDIEFRRSFNSHLRIPHSLENCQNCQNCKTAKLQNCKTAKTAKTAKLKSLSRAENARGRLWRLFAHLVISPLVDRYGSEEEFEITRQQHLRKSRCRSM